MRVDNKGFSKKQIITISAIVLVLLAVLIAILVYRSQIRATTMRLLRIEGTVTMEEDGKVKDIRENARLKSGNAIDTSVKSLASIGLDDYKVVTLDEISRAEFNQSGKYLNLNLKKGSLFFEVDKALADDETFEIETSTMIVGIRGTSGWVSVAGEHESLIITDGHVHVIGTNPVTGEVKEIEVSAGQRVTVYLYNDREVDSIMFELEDITERDLPDFVLDRLREDPELLDRVISATGWDKPWILGEDEEEPEQDEEPDEGDNGSGSDAEPEPEPEPEIIVEPDETDEVGDVGGNDNEQVADNTNLVTPVAVPTLSALDRQKEEARAQIVSENEDGTLTLADGTVFDPEYYAERYPEVAEVYGDDPESLLAHYIAHGAEEGRYASNDEEQAAELAEDIARLEEQRLTNEAIAAQQTQPTQQTTTPQSTVVTTNTTTNAALDAGGNFNWNGVQGRFQNGVLTINGLTNPNSTIADIPATVYDPNTDTNENVVIDKIVVNSSQVTGINAENLNPTVADLKSFVASQNPSAANVANIVTAQSGSIKVGYNQLTNFQASPYGYISTVAMGNSDSVSTFMDLISNFATNGLDRVDFGQDPAKNNSTAGTPDYFVVNGNSIAANNYFPQYTGRDVTYYGTMPYVDVIYTSTGTNTYMVTGSTYANGGGGNLPALIVDDNGVGQ